MTVRNLSIDRMGRWMAAGLTTAGLSVALIPTVQGGLFPESPAREQSVTLPNGQAVTRSTKMTGSDANQTLVSSRRRSTRTPVTVVPPGGVQQQPQAAPVGYPPQPMYYSPYGVPVTPGVMPQPYMPQPQPAAADDSSPVARELRRLYEESGREVPAMQGMPQPAAQAQQNVPLMPQPYAAPPGYIAVPGGFVPAPGFIPAQGYSATPGFIPQQAYGMPVIPLQAGAAGATSATGGRKAEDLNEDPDFFPGDSVASGGALDGLEFEESAPAVQTQPVMPQPLVAQPLYPVYPPVGAMPLQPLVQPMPGSEPLAMPEADDAAEETSRSKSPLIVQEALPSTEALTGGSQVKPDTEMLADPKGSRKKLFGLFGGSSVTATQPPAEPKTYVPSGVVEGKQTSLFPDESSDTSITSLMEEATESNGITDSDLPPELMSASLAKTTDETTASTTAKAAETADSTESEPATLAEVKAPQPVSVSSASPITRGASRGKNYASELFRDDPTDAVDSVTPAPEVKKVSEAVPAKNSKGIATGGFIPGGLISSEKKLLTEGAAPEKKTAELTPVEETPALSGKPAAFPTPEVLQDVASKPRAITSEDTASSKAEPKVRSVYFAPRAQETLPTESVISEPAQLKVPADQTSSEIPSEAPRTLEAESIRDTRPVTADIKAAPVSERDAHTQSKFEQISTRPGTTGLKGFCPVRLRDHREMTDGQAAFTAEHRGRIYVLSSAQALRTFLANPDKYAPVEGGVDLVARKADGTVAEGSLEHSVWYKGNLYLFATAANKDLFVANPSEYGVQ